MDKFIKSLNKLKTICKDGILMLDNAPLITFEFWVVILIDYSTFRIYMMVRFGKKIVLLKCVMYLRCS